MIDNNRSADRGWLTPMSSALFMVAAIAWAVTAHRARSMEEMTGSMGMSLPSFIAMWSLMMAAMMFPSVAPLASRYTRMIRSRRWFGLAFFATGGVAFLLAWSLGELVVLNNATVAKLVAAMTFAFTPAWT